MLPAVTARFLQRMVAVGVLFAGSISSAAFAWENTAGQNERGTYCATGNTFADGTSVAFVITEDSYRDGFIGMIVGNSDWTLGPNDDPGDVSIITAEAGFEDAPGMGIPNGFARHLSSSNFPHFVRDATASGAFSVVRNGKQIGPYPAQGLSLAYSILLECARAEYEPRDPFAK